MKTLKKLLKKFNDTDNYISFNMKYLLFLMKMNYFRHNIC